MERQEGKVIKMEKQTLNREQMLKRLEAYSKLIGNHQEESTEEDESNGNDL